MKRSRLVVHVLVLAAAGWWLSATPAHANHLEDVCTRSDSGQNLYQHIYIPVNISHIGRDVKEGDAYGPWFKHSITWTCTRKAELHPGHSFQPDDDYFEVQTRYYPDGAVQLGSLLAADPSYRVYQYGLHLGFIARITQHIDGQTPQTTPVNTSSTGGAATITTKFKGSTTRQVGDVSKFHFTLEVRLVKQKEPILKQAVLLFIVNNVDTTNCYKHHGHHDTINWVARTHMYNQLDISQQDVQGACTTPDQTV